MYRIPSARAAGLAWPSIAAFLVLFAPFLSYLEYQRYGFGNPEVVVFLLLLAGVALVVGVIAQRSPGAGALALAGLLTFLFDVQAREPGLKKLGLIFLVLSAVLYVLRRHAPKIVAGMMVTVVVSTVLFPARFEATASASGQALPPQADRKDLPLVLHLLLDEFMGAGGLPEDVTPPGFKRHVASFFTDRGFRLFGRAYSEYPMTQWSVPQLLNLAPGHFIPDLTVPGPTGGTARLRHNLYFTRLADMGYSVKVHEPDYIYLCPDGTPAECHTYATRSLNVLNQLDHVPLSARLSVVAGTFLGQSEAYTRTKAKYQELRRRFGMRSLPPWDWDRGIPTSASSMRMFDEVAKDLSTATRGTAIFAHILVPHYPYVFDSNCRQRPAGEWMDRSDPEYADVGSGIINVAASRAARYAAYAEQVGCAERQIDRMIAAIPAPLRRDAIIIVQGDHGSRITMVDPTTTAPVAPRDSDFADAFSTMFAVRSASIAPGYDMQIAPITCLLRSLVDTRFTSTAGIQSCASPHTVYFMAGGDAPVPRPLQGFWVENAAGDPVVTSGTARPPVVSVIGTK